MISRRDFIRNTSLGIVGVAGGLHTLDGFSLPNAGPQDLYSLSAGLVDTWAKKLLSLQVTDKSQTDDYGGIRCPTFKIVHGRVGDTIYPFFYMADKTKESKYIDASVLLFRWLERRVSQADGSWLNEPVQGSWTGTTIFTIIALCDALTYHGALFDPSFKKEVIDRLQKAGDFVYNTFSIDYGNINYPIAASYGLSLLGNVLDNQRFRTRGKDFAHQALNFISRNDKLIYGEGDPYYEASRKGCYSVDLGYNVEESLPSLVQYALLTNDQEVLEAVTESMQSHMEFMLPDGGWDNSWGTRNYKWTYWGSRTSDGCQPAYALLADRDLRFYKAALKNTELLQQCTSNGLLYGGPHYIAHGIQPSVHHTFCHIKALVTVLEHQPHTKVDVNKISLPREAEYGVRLFKDIQTWLIAKGKFRATITGYDREYKKTKNGHATGGALTMLWHESAGVLFSASMNEYQLIESGNMQADHDPLSMPLTPRVELQLNGHTYINICDLNATLDVRENSDELIVNTTSRLVDKDQNSPSSGEIVCHVSYRFTSDKVSLHFKCETKNDTRVQIIFPLISASAEKVNIVSEQKIRIKKHQATVSLFSDRKMIQLPTTDKGRIFNYVPGFEAIPLCIQHHEASIEIEVS